MYKNEMALRNVLGVIPTYMRPPYSSCTAGPPHLPTLRISRTDLPVKHVVVKPISLNLATILPISYVSPFSPLPIPSFLTTSRDLDTQDYLNDSPTLIINSENIFDATLANASSTTDDFLVISHDIHNQTSQVLVEYMLKGLLSKGYKPVTVGQCLGDLAANWYRVDTTSTLG
jgi:hypothetical protein